MVIVLLMLEFVINKTQIKGENRQNLTIHNIRNERTKLHRPVGIPGDCCFFYSCTICGNKYLIQDEYENHICSGVNIR